MDDLENREGYHHVGMLVSSPTKMGFRYADLGMVPVDRIKIQRI